MLASRILLFCCVAIGLGWAIRSLDTIPTADALVFQGLLVLLLVLLFESHPLIRIPARRGRRQSRGARRAPHAACPQSPATPDLHDPDVQEIVSEDLSTEIDLDGDNFATLSCHPPRFGLVSCRQA